MPKSDEWFMGAGLMSLAKTIVVLDEWVDVQNYSRLPGRLLEM